MAERCDESERDSVNNLCKRASRPLKILFSYKDQAWIYVCVSFFVGFFKVLSGFFLRFCRSFDRSSRPIPELFNFCNARVNRIN